MRKKVFKSHVKKDIKRKLNKKILYKKKHKKMNSFFITCKESRIENPRNFYGCFYLGSFEEGDGLTVANALRRTLLSECSGLAIISVLIENVKHEFSTLVGVRDSVLDILLNIKEIVIKKKENPWRLFKKKSCSSIYEKVGRSFFKPVIGYLKVKGPGIVRAKDLRLPPFIQCVDPNQYIASLSEDGVLNMKVIIMEGKGYIIQKSNSIIDQDFIKKRRSLLNQLQSLYQTTKQGTEKQNDIKKESSFSKNKKTSSLPSPTWLEPRLKKQTSKKKQLTFFNNATPLNIDAVFSPVTKVSYIIEVSENQILDKEMDKISFIDEIASLLESSSFLKKQFPFLTTVYDPILVNKRYSDKHQSFSKYQNYPNSEFLIETKGMEKQNDQKPLKELIHYVDTFSDSEWISSYQSLHPLSLIKKRSLHHIFLEIWTNGSLHPRDALALAFFKLSSLFSHFEKTQLWNPIFKDFPSYKKLLALLTNKENN